MNDRVSTEEAERPGTRVRETQKGLPMAGRGGAPLALVALFLFELALQGAAEPLVPAVFVFGDSTVDVGNNNNITESCIVGCIVNHPHYGVDYPFQQPTGRFSNGHNLADQIAQHLGFTESPRAFFSLPDNESIILQKMKSGINFASGGSGLLDETGSAVCHCSQVFNMSAQVQSFSSLVPKMGNGAADLISNSIIFISAGSNDLIMYANAPSPSPNRNDTEFLQSLIASYTSYLKELYGAGARKFSVVSPSLVGCCPSQRVVANERHDVDRFGCFGSANNLSRQLYPMVESMLDDLTLELPGMNYSLGNSIRMVENVLNGNVLPGMNLTAACCGSGGCNHTSSLCPNRASYLFWDDYHPTDAASNFSARVLFSDTGSFVYPINVQQLAALRK